MKVEIEARVDNADGVHEVKVATQGKSQSLGIPAKTGGQGCSVNGGELLLLAVATCYCNDLYREAKRMGITVRGVRVQARAAFDATPGSAAEGISYVADVDADATPEQVAELLRCTDAVAEVHNTLRRGCAVTLGG